jgi:DnaJ-domain-containing protein 1
MNRAVVFILAGLVYLIWPFDMAPDYIAVVGWLDDLLVLGVTIYMAAQSMKRRVKSGPGRTRQKTAPPRSDDEILRDPYEILGISHDASAEEVKNAYRRKMAKYHPDKVDHLGDDFKKIAEEKAKAIQEAYERISR